MPIHLAPLSRRAFLRRSVAASAGVLLAPELLAETRKPSENLWALLSDVHIAADRNLTARGSSLTGNFQSVSRELLALPERPAGVFITGDCAYNSGQKGDYAVLVDLLEPLRRGQMPVHLALGNHDHRQRFWAALQDDETARRRLVDRQVALLETPLVNWFILDSLDQTASTPGLLGKEQLTWLAASLDANSTKPALVLIHHNPGLSGNLGLKDTVALFETIRPRKQVKAYVYGHTHAWKVDQDSSGLHLINLPAVSYAFQVGEPTGWVRATVAPGGMRLELRCTDPTHKAHGQSIELKWRAG